MYQIEITTDSSSLVVSLSELKAHLRLNTGSAEDNDLTAYILTAQHMFEAYTGRSLVTREYRQHVPKLDQPIYLMRYPIQSIDAVKYYDEADNLQTDNTYYSDIVSLPAQVWWENYPNTDPAIRQPVAYVEFTAGYTTCPEMVKTAVKLAAGTYYAHRESYTELGLSELPFGFRAVCEQYKTGLVGPWGM